MLSRFTSIGHIFENESINTITDIMGSIIDIPYSQSSATTYNYNFLITTLPIGDATSYYGMSAMSFSGQYICVPQMTKGIWVSNNYGSNWVLTIYNDTCYLASVSSSGKYIWVCSLSKAL